MSEIRSADTNCVSRRLRRWFGFGLGLALALEPGLPEPGLPLLDFRAMDVKMDAEVTAE
ncbi:MAG: hypothetical protein NTX53_10410 [candidate division WOR-3 bacterium]|nr:hypothetical protein [candidate division WOR-3 bacterium]